jgi:hypothetical protein
LEIAIAIPMSTNTTIATCVQIHVGDTAAKATARDPAQPVRGANMV